jgi:hypothetical protein
VTAEIPTIEPTSITAGDTLRWLKQLDDYTPDDGWVLTYALVISGVKVAITASDYGDGRHYVNVTATTTAGWTADDYDWQSYVTRAATSERYAVGSGRLQVLPNYAAASSGYDARTHARKMLDAIESVLEGRGTRGDLDMISSVIGDRQLARKPELLLALRDRYRAEVASELAASRLQASGRVLVRL